MPMVPTAERFGRKDDRPSMRTRLASAVVSLCIPALAGLACAQPPATSQTLHWFKGNLHTHTNKSDGDATPVVVARWYRDQDYDFLALTDHNKLVDPQAVAAELGDAKGRKPFLLVAGEEVTDGLKDGPRPAAIHLGALGTTRTVGAQGGKTVPEVLARCIKAIRAGGGVAIVNHPNFVWSLTPADLLSNPEITHFEVYNAHPIVHNLGGGGKPSTEQMWDRVLSTGRPLYGLATDDAHYYAKFTLKHANPGRGWVCVRAAALTPDAILAALQAGNFYASTGVDLSDIQTTGGVLRLTIVPGWASSPNMAEKYSTQFIGRDGKVLKTDLSLEPKYRLKPGDLYVRAKVTSSNGGHAWTQALFARARR